VRLDARNGILPRSHATAHHLRIVPEVDLTEPRDLKMTLKERIADHRNKAGVCILSTQEFEPLGDSRLENYDALGALPRSNQ